MDVDRKLDALINELYQSNGMDRSLFSSPAVSPGESPKRLDLRMELDFRKSDQQWKLYKQSGLLLELQDTITQLRKQHSEQIQQLNTDLAEAKRANRHLRSQLNDISEQQRARLPSILESQSRKNKVKSKGNRRRKPHSKRPVFR